MTKKILYLQYTNPAGYPPLEHSSRILANDSWHVLFLGIGSFGANDLRFPSHVRIQVRQLSFSPAGWRQKLHYLRFACWVVLWTLRWRPQWIYASDHLSAPVALVLSFLPGLSVVYHEHDSPVTIQGSIFLRFCLAARHWLAGRAELCILPNQRRLEKFREETRATSKVACVWNCPRRDEVLSPRYFSQNSALSLYYHGNLSPQLLPPEIINAIADNSYEIRLTVVGYETIGSEGYRFFLQKEAMRLGVSDRVRILAPRPRQELWQYMWECDVGLALFPVTCSNTNLQHLVGASNKVFDYMAAGLALIVSESPDWREMFVMNGYALACDPTNAVSIAATLRWACEHPLEVRAMGERGRQRIAANWNYEAQFAWVRESLF